jgi:predicted nucleotide-binding protein
MSIQSRVHLARSKESVKKQLNDQIEKIKSQLLVLPTNRAQLEDDVFRAEHWRIYNEELLSRSFTEHDNKYLIDYKNLSIKYPFKINPDERIWSFLLDEFAAASRKHITYLEAVIAVIDMFDEKEESSPAPKVEFKSVPQVTTPSRKVFIIHGRNSEVKNSVARFIEKEMKLETVILHEEPSKGLTVIDKFEKHSDVGFAVALWTKDDLGRHNEETTWKDRARQNVIFETGFFIGKLGRSKVLVLFQEGIEIPTDYSGVIMIPYSGHWKYELEKEIKAIYETKGI